MKVRINAALVTGGGQLWSLFDPSQVHPFVMAFTARRKIVKEGGKVCRDRNSGAVGGGERPVVGAWLSDAPRPGPILCFQSPDDFEESVAQALFDLEATNNGAPGRRS